MMEKGLVRYGAWDEMRKAFFSIVVFFCLAGAAAAERVTVLAFGDSLTQGFGLTEAEGFVPQLQGWLEDHGADVVLMNGGVSGDTTAGGAARIVWSLTPEIDAMILTLGGNDMLRGLPPEEAKANLSEIIAQAKLRDVAVLLVAMQAPQNYGEDYKNAFDYMYFELSENLDVPLAPSFLSALGETPAEALDFMQADGVHPNAKGVLRIVGVLGPYVLELAERAARGP